MCGKALEDAQRDAERAERSRALAVPGTVAAKFPGTCVCGDQFPVDTPVRKHRDGWYDALAHPEGPDA